MRGAGLRLNNDVRRLWRCGVCAAERKIGGQVTAVRCQCEGRPAMSLVEGKRLERPLKELSSPYLEFVFEPGELAPPRSQVEEVQPSPKDELPLDAETSSAMESEVNEGGPAPLEGEETRPESQSRPPRRNDRRGDRGPAPPPRGPQGRNDKGPRRETPPPRDQPSRGGQRGPGDRQPDAARGNAPAAVKPPNQDRPPRQEKPPRQRNEQRDDRPAPPPHAADNSGFGEGIPEDRAPQS